MDKLTDAEQPDALKKMTAARDEAIKAWRAWEAKYKSDYWLIFVGVLSMAVTVCAFICAVIYWGMWMMDRPTPTPPTVASTCELKMARPTVYTVRDGSRIMLRFDDRLRAHVPVGVDCHEAYRFCNARGIKACSSIDLDDCHEVD